MTYFLIIVTSMVAIIGWLKPQKTPRWLIILVSLILIGAVVIQIVIEKEQSYKEKTRKFAGILNSEPKESLHKPSIKRLDLGWTLYRKGYSFEFEESLSEIFQNARPGNKRFLQILEDIAFEYDFDDQ